jgi:hypothetical protein
MNTLKVFLWTIFITIVGSCGKYPEDLGNGYAVDFLFTSGSEKMVIGSNNTVIIGGPLLEYKYNSDYIIATERPFDSVRECRDGYEQDYKSCKKAFEESTFCQYWIINKHTHKIFGPIKFAEYQSKVEELAIPKDICICEVK